MSTENLKTNPHANVMSALALTNMVTVETLVPVAGGGGLGWTHGQRVGWYSSRPRCNLGVSVQNHVQMYLQAAFLSFCSFLTHVYIR